MNVVLFLVAVTALLEKLPRQPGGLVNLSSSDLQDPASDPNCILRIGTQIVDFTNVPAASVVDLSGNSYVVHPCRQPTAFPECPSELPCNSFQESVLKRCYCLGLIASASWDVIQRDGVQVIEIAHIQGDSNRENRISVRCGPREILPSSVTETPSLTYNFEYTSPLACSGTAVKDIWVGVANTPAHRLRLNGTITSDDYVDDLIRAIRDDLYPNTKLDALTVYFGTWHTLFPDMIVAKGPKLLTNDPLSKYFSGSPVWNISLAVRT